MEAFGKFVFFILLAIVGSIFDGYTFSTLWRWFISDLFGVMQLTIAQSIGVGMFVKYATTRVTKAQIEAEESNDGFEGSFKVFVVGQILNVFFLIFGAIIKALI